MATVSGVVEAVSTKFGKFSILVNGKWYATKEEWAKVKPNKGESVTFDDGGKNYLKALMVKRDEGSSPTATAGGGSKGGGRSYGKFPIDPLDGQRSIIRQNAVTNANAFLSTLVSSGKTDDVEVSDLLDIARQIEAYTAGDLDVVEAEARVAKMSESFDVDEMM